MNVKDVISWLLVLKAVQSVEHFFVTVVLKTLLSLLVIAAVGICVIIVLVTLTFDK